MDVCTYTAPVAQSSLLLDNPTGDCAAGFLGRNEPPQYVQRFLLEFSVVAYR
jgi:hypothetical protein